MLEIISAIFMWVAAAMGVEDSQPPPLVIVSSTQAEIQKIVCENKGCKDVIVFTDAKIMVARDFAWNQPLAAALFVKPIVHHLQYHVLCGEDAETFSKGRAHFDDQASKILRQFMTALGIIQEAKIRYYEQIPRKDS